MNNRIVLATCLLVLSGASTADIFKCVVDGKAHYQANPCKEETHETALGIKTVDRQANQRGEIARQQFELHQAEKKLMEAEAAEANARAMAAAANAQRQAAAAEAQLRAADSYERSVESQQQRDEAFSKYLYKKAGMSPTFGR